MKIFIPFATGSGPFSGKGLRPETRALGEQVGAVFVDCTGRDTAYFEHLKKRWAEGESFINIEQDVQASPELLEDMASCPEPWCAGFYWHYSGTVLPGEDRPQNPVRHPGVYLCCHKFGAALLKRVPGALWQQGAAQHWASLDLPLMGTLAQNGARVHLHKPALRHRGANPPAWALAMTEDDWTRVDG